jgi:hypothetical protein
MLPLNTADPTGTVPTPSLLIARLLIVDKSAKTLPDARDLENAMSSGSRCERPAKGAHSDGSFEPEQVSLPSKI